MEGDEKEKLKELYKMIEDFEMEINRKIEEVKMEQKKLQRSLDSLRERVDYHNIW